MIMIHPDPLFNPRGNVLLEIYTRYQDIKDISRISEVYETDIMRKLIRFQLSIWQIFAEYQKYVLVISGYSIRYQSGPWSKSNEVKNRWKQHCFNRVLEPDIKGYEPETNAFFYTGYHEFSPLDPYAGTLLTLSLHHED